MSTHSIHSAGSIRYSGFVGPMIPEQAITVVGGPRLRSTKSANASTDEASLSVAVLGDMSDLE